MIITKIKLSFLFYKTHCSLASLVLIRQNRVTCSIVRKSCSEILSESEWLHFNNYQPAADCYLTITTKRGNAQRDGCPLGGSVSPYIECYWLVNASPLNYGRWVGQNAGPIFSRLCIEVHQIKFACVGVSVVCNAVFLLTISCCALEIFTIKSWSCAKSRRKLVFGPANFGGRGHRNFWPNFINLAHRGPRGKVWWQSAKRHRRLGGKKIRSKLQR